MSMEEIDGFVDVNDISVVYEVVSFDRLDDSRANSREFGWLPDEHLIDFDAVKPLAPYLPDK